MEKKKKKKLIIGTAICLGAVAISGVAVYCHLLNKEGSSLWVKHSSLKELKNYREKVAKQFRNAGINNLSDEEYNKVEKTLFKLDNIIGTIENAIFDREHPNARLPQSNNGWYLTSNE